MAFPDFVQSPGDEESSAAMWAKARAAAMS
jgi:hypothetical protein